MDTKDRLTHESSHDTYARLMEHITTLPAVDAHDHLRPLSHFVQPVTVCGLLSNTYLMRSMRAADGSSSGISGRSEFPCGDTWEEARSVAEKVRFSSYYRWLMRGLTDLYELPTDDLTETAYEILSSEVPKRYSDPSWFSTALDRASIASVVWDPFWMPGTWEVPDRRLVPSLRITSSLVAFHPDTDDYEGRNVIRDWAERFDIEVDSLGDLEELLDRLLAQNIEAGCRSLKSPMAYDRTLEVRRVSRADASAVFGSRPASVSPERRLLFGDYIVHWFLERARDHGLVFQVHTGLARLSGSNPLLLMPLIEQYPDVVFDVFHGGYPWVHEVGALSQNYPNVRLNLAWLPQLSTETAVHSLQEWLQVGLQVDRITWGADCWTVEEMYGATLATRHVVARALAGLVEDGHFGVDDAMKAAESVMTRGGAAIYRIDVA